MREHGGSPPIVARSLGSYLLTLICFSLLSTAGHTQQQTSIPPPPPNFTINVNVDEVVLHATVRKRGGTLVTGLGKDDFQVSEDGAAQQIKHFSYQDIPVTAGLVIDNSGSMRPKRAEVIAAALAFAGSSNPQDQMFLVNFNEHVSFGLPRNVDFTDQADQLRAAMSTVKSDGKTALYDAVAIALEHLKKGNRDKRVLIVVSDGADNASKYTKEQVLALARRNDAIIYTIGIYEPEDPDNRNPEVMRELAKASGGGSFFPETLQEVRPICERIANEVRNQYTLSYVPTNQKQDGTFRHLRVEVKSEAGRGMKVSTRVGYEAPLNVPTVSTPDTKARK